MATKTTVRVRDLMRTDVITLDPNDSLREAVRILEDNDITGAPVVDAGGRPVGILTLRDVARADHMTGRAIDTRMRDDDLAEVPSDLTEDQGPSAAVIEEKEDYSPRVLGEGSVQDWMQPLEHSVTPDVELTEACRRMLDGHTHRLLVLEGDAIRGVLTSIDVVRHVAQSNGA